MDLSKISIKKIPLKEMIIKKFLRNCNTLTSILQYTLEVIMLYTMSTLFHCMKNSVAVRLATLADQLNIYANVHIQHVMNLKEKDKKEKDKRDTEHKGSHTNTILSQKKKKGIPSPDVQYALGRLMVTFLNERGLITITDLLDDSNQTIKGKDGKFFNKKASQYVICNFDIRF